LIDVQISCQESHQNFGSYLPFFLKFRIIFEIPIWFKTYNFLKGMVQHLFWKRWRASIPLCKDCHCWRSFLYSYQLSLVGCKAMVWSLRDVFFHFCFRWKPVEEFQPLRTIKLCFSLCSIVAQASCWGLKACCDWCRANSFRYHDA